MVRGFADAMDHKGIELHMNCNVAVRGLLIQHCLLFLACRGTGKDWMNTARWELVWIRDYEDFCRIRDNAGYGKFNSITGNKNCTGEKMSAGYYVFTCDDAALSKCVEIRPVETQICWLVEDFAKL